MKGYKFVIFFWVKDQKDKQCRFIFSSAFADIYQGTNISAGHCNFVLFLPV